MAGDGPQRPHRDSAMSNKVSCVVVALVGSLVLALPAVASDSGEACSVEGTTARWAMAYCMTRHETDDDAHPGVSDCYRKELQQKLVDVAEEDCPTNLAYKSAICAILIEWKLYEDTLASCIESEQMVPSVVKNGIG